MNTPNGLFDGLFCYEKLMLICGFMLFVFALAAITVMIVQRRDFKMAMVLIIFAIVLMGFPGIQAIKFSKGMVEVDRIRGQVDGPSSPAQKQQEQRTLSAVQERAGDNPQLLAQVSDGYRAIGDVNTAYDLAKSVLQQKPSAAVQKTLIPVLTAKLNQVQAATPVPAPATTPSSSGASAAPPAESPAPPPVAHDVPATPVDTTASSATPADIARQQEIATIAHQLQASAAPLPAASHVALARAWVVLDQPEQARANIDAARRIDPAIRISPAVLSAARMRAH